MNGPRDLLTRPLRHYTTGIQAGHRLISRLQHRFLRLYLPIVAATALLITDLSTVLFRTIIAPATVLINQLLILIVQETLPVLNDAIVATVSAMDTVTVIAIYSLYVWTDTAVQVVQMVLNAQVPSTEALPEAEVPGGIVVWLVVMFALVTYAFVYHQYPTHEDWVATVFSIVLPLLTRSLWKSD